MITVEQIMNYNPCKCYPKRRVKDIIENGMTIEEYLDLDESLFDSIKDKYWVLWRCDLLTEKQLHLIAVRAAEIVLPIFEKRHPDDKRPREAIDAKKKWINGEIKDNELINAATAAVDAAAYATDAASTYAAYAAAVAEIYRKLFEYIREII